MVYNYNIVLNFKKHGLIHKENFFTKKQFQQIVNECKIYHKYLKQDTRNKNRLIVIIPKKSIIYKMLYGEKSPIKLFIEKLSNKKTIQPDFPIEYRMYPKGSQGMHWHSDLQLYKKAQYEVVLTVYNSSDSRLLWLDKQINKYTIKSKSNSVTIVKPNTALHKVTPLNKGFRTILKFIYIFDKEKCSNSYKNEVKHLKSFR